jgi:hypothetical protein
VSRTKSSEISLRNDQIYSEWRGGRSLSWLADKYQRTPQQMGRIVADRHPDLEDDLDRSLHRGRLETLYEEVQSIVDNPGWKLAPNGRLAQDDDGNALYDTSAKIEALKLKLLVLESARKLDARDKAAKPPPLPPGVAEQQMWAALAVEQQKMEGRQLAAAERAELEALRRKLGNVTPGEVVRELPAASDRP